MRTVKERNQAVYRRLHDAINSRDLDRIVRTADEVFHPDAVFHPTPSTAVPAAAAVKDVWAMLLRAFPDIHVQVEDTIADGDRLVLRNTVTGTHRGEYRGQPATGRTITYHEVFIVRFSEGRVAEGWGIVDVHSQLQQLGAVRG